MDAARMPNSFDEYIDVTFAYTLAYIIVLLNFNQKQILLVTEIYL